MTFWKRRALRLLAFVTFVTMMQGQWRQIIANHTNVGVPASESYVNFADQRQVIIYVGDSRVMYCTCGTDKKRVRANFAFCFVNGGNVTVIDRAGGSLAPFLENCISKYRKRKPVIIFNLGLNGNSHPAGNAERIIRIYRSWMKAYPDLRFYVEGIGPTILDYGSYSNQKVIRLNKKLQVEYEPAGMWIDTYTSILNRGLIDSAGKGMKDKYHYKWNTSKKILKMLRKRVENDITNEAS